MCPINGYIDTVFATSGDLTPVPDALQSNGSVSYQQGFPILYSTAVGSGGYNFPRGAHNQILHDITAAIQQYQQSGIPPFITTTMNGGSPYSYSQYNMALSGGVAYISLVNTNTDTPPSSKWAAITLGTGLIASNDLSDVASATTARANLIAAKSGSNSDITNLTGLTGLTVNGSNGDEVYFENDTIGRTFFAGKPSIGTLIGWAGTGGMLQSAAASLGYTGGLAIQPYGGVTQIGAATLTSGIVNIKTNTGINGAIVAYTTGTLDTILACYTSTSTYAGGITVSGSTTTFATSSDYRLKTNVEPLSDAIERLNSVPARRFNWHSDADGAEKTDGFLAHEVQAFVPNAVVGEKDATRTAVDVILDADGHMLGENVTEEAFAHGKLSELTHLKRVLCLAEDGSPLLDAEGQPVTKDVTETVKLTPAYPPDATRVPTLVVPVYQAMDNSKLVPILWAAVQELSAKVAALEGNKGK